MNIFQITLNLSQFVPAEETEGMLTILRCSWDVVVTYTPRLHTIIVDTIKSQGLWFDSWIHSQMVYKVEKLEYNAL